jgi:hypothetical protein
MNTPHRKSAVANRRGFALLITITLLAFLVLLLVSLASLTRVETRVAGNAQMLAVARQNALLSLNLAIGRLQKYAGPDDRLTARAEITASGPALQPYLTGVWASANATAIPDAWLVSGDPANPLATGDLLDPAADAAPYAEGAAPWVCLLGNASVGAGSDRVRMSTRAIDAPAGSVPGLTGAATLGRYAWWIGDEGVKASASLVDPLLLPNAISYDSGGATGDNWSDNVNRARLNQLQPVRPRLERMFGGLDPDAAASAGQLPRISQLAQLELVAGGPAAASRKTAFHSVTPLSEAVLVDSYDITDIRLRRDLSDLTGTLHSGLSAGQTQSVRAYQQFRVSIPDPTAAPYAATFKPTTAITSEFPAFHAGPVVTEFGLRCSFDVNASGQIVLVYWIDVELWNPYSARLVTDAATQLSLDLATDIVVTARDDKGGGHVINITKLIREANGVVDTKFKGILVDAGEEWAAGEVKLLSGGSALSSTTPLEGNLSSGAVVAAGATKIVSVDLPAVGSLELALRVNQGSTRPSTIQAEIPKPAFTAVSGAPQPDLADSSAPRYAFGYGYRLVNNFSRWLQSSGSNGRDVRYLSLGDDYPTAGATVISDTGSSWDSDPTANINLSPDGLFVNLDWLVFYDLPRQELVSVGDLRQLAGRKTSEMGNSHGSSSGNRWFDNYYFSTVPRVHAWDFAGGEPLPNRYIRYIPSERAAATLTDLRDDENAARFLLQHGAFNINSTSVDAWRMMLGQRLAGWKAISTQAEPAGAVDLDNVFLRLPHGAQQLPNAPVANGEPITNTPAAIAALTGGRRVTDAQISALAQKIVGQLKARGYPFPSINALLISGVFRLALVDAGILPTNTASLPPGAGVSQADVVCQLAPVLTPRSDTFRIRAYGDSRNPVTGDVEGRAWCEAVMQRVPDVTAPVSGVYATGDELKLSTTKYPFGRKFKIVSFRWLTPQDI